MKAPSRISKPPISIFSPITPVCSISLSATVIPLKSEAKNSSLDEKLIAFSTNSLAKVTKASFLPTKSVSQFKVIIAPLVLSALTKETAAPSVDSRSERFAATFCPFFLRFSIALSKSPSASTKAFLQSIIPAPVICLNLFTSAAVIVAICFLF
ncbi:hypothetical protein D9M72_322350 [compost metagenome]